MYMSSFMLFSMPPNSPFGYPITRMMRLNELFLEFIQAEQLEGDAPPEGFWFIDLLKRGVLGAKARLGSEQEVAEKQAWLRQWGYGEDDSKVPASPFEARHPGLLAWSTSNPQVVATNRFISEAQQRTNGTLIPVEPLYAATTFGLLALELLTTTGMRVNELMQVSLLPECIVRMVDDPPPGASDQTPRIRFSHQQYSLLEHRARQECTGTPPGLARDAVPPDQRQNQSRVDQQACQNSPTS